MKRNSKGFTLIEVVIAISILVVILGTAYSAITQIITTKKMLDDKRDNAMVAYSIVRRLGRELQLVTAEKPLIFNTPGAVSASTVKFLGSTKAGSGMSSDYDDSLTFLAMEGGQYMPDGGTHTGIVQITYRLAKDPDNKDSGLSSLVREEVPYAVVPGTNDAKAWKTALDRSFSKRMVFPIADNVASFSLKYYDIEQNQWLDEWGTAQKDVPAMVYYSITLVSPQGISETYATAVPISSGR